MKRVSAFSVFKAKKQDKEDVPDTNLRASIRRAASAPSIKDDVKKATAQTKGKKIMKALKGGTLRVSMRGTPKSRPTVLKTLDKASIASDENTVKLTMMRSNTDLSSMEEVNEDSGNLPSTFETPKPPLPVKPSRNKASKPPTSKPSVSENLNPSVSAPNLTQTKPRRDSPRALTEVQGKELTLIQKELRVSLYAAQMVPVDKSPLTAQNRGGQSGSSSGKRKRQKKELGSPTQTNKKRKSNEFHHHDCSTEEIVQSMSFQDETDLQGAPPPYMFDSYAEASKVFQCLIHPVQPDKFFSELWERKPLLVKRHMADYNNAWFSTAELDKILRERNIQFSRNLDVTTYTNGERQTHNPPGRAYPGIVWDYYQNGCSVRLLNPQTYSRNVWKLLSVLQEYFGCFVGANVYLTPPGTQGFAPHYDDIEAFILQLEGSKHWKLYSPRTDAETLPRFSSGNFREEDMGKPILDVVLHPGDLLYFPRGTIHQGRTQDNAHSLHITVSCYQKNTWGDLFEKMLPRALQIAMEDDVEFRQGLPLNYLNYMGIAHSDQDSEPRRAFLNKLEQLMSRLIDHLPVDASVDQLGKQFVQDILPPVISETERMRSIHGVGATWDNEGRSVVGTVELEPDSHIKLIRKGVLRLLTEEDEVRIYHCLDNTRTYREAEPQFFDISPESAPGVEFLIHNYPNYVTVDSLPLASIDQKIEIATALYEKGLLVTEDTLDPIDGED